MINRAKQSFLKDAEIVTQALDDYFKECKKGQHPVLRQKNTEELIDQLDLAKHIDSGDLSGEVLRQFVVNYLAETTRLRHPGFLAHQVAIPHPTGALGSLIDGATNNAMAIYEMGPAAASIEYFMVNWMLEKVGWKTVPAGEQLSETSDHSGGVLTHGGSLANTTALLAARSAKIPQFWDEGSSGTYVVLVPEQSHYSLKRSVATLGLGANNCITLPADPDGRVNPSAIPPLLEQLKEEGKQVMAIVANACGTAAGLYDPLEAIADICQHHDIWLHVDAAHGGGALVSENQRHLTRGIERADSIIWDAHKMLSTPTVCAAILTKDHRHLDHAFQLEASYLLHAKDQPGFDFLPRAVECTKAGLGLRFFMSIAAMGEHGLAQRIDRLVSTAQNAASWLAEQIDFEVAIYPETNIVCFRYGDVDEQQLEIRRQLLAQGDFYISTTLYRGVRWMRLVFMNPETHLQDIQQMAKEIEAIHQNTFRHSQ